MGTSTVNTRALAQTFSTRLLRELSRRTPARWAHERLAQVTSVADGDERVAVLNRQMGYEVDAPSALLYRRTIELFATLPVEVAYTESMAELRDRDAKGRDVLRSADLPTPLIAAAHGLELSGLAWKRLGALLKQPAARYS